MTQSLVRTESTCFSAARLFAGGAGNVINTQTRATVGRMGALVGSRYNIEIDWAGRRVCAAYPRESLGYLHVAPRCAAPAR